MTSMGAGLALISQICFICLLASMIKPHWFRFNGKTPGRMKIGGLWMLMLVLSLGGAMWRGGAPIPDEVPTTATQSAPELETMAVPLDIAVPQASPVPAEEEAAMDDTLMDAARPAEVAAPTAMPVVPGPVYSERRLPR